MNVSSNMILSSKLMRGVLLFLHIRRPLNRSELCDELLLWCKPLCFPSIVISSRLRHRDFEISAPPAHNTSHCCVVQGRQRREVLLQQSLARCQACRIVWTCSVRSSQLRFLLNTTYRHTCHHNIPYTPPLASNVYLQRHSRATCENDTLEAPLSA